jgi:hypothetical protein
VAYLLAMEIIPAGQQRARKGATAADLSAKTTRTDADYADRPELAAQELAISLHVFRDSQTGQISFAPLATMVEGG